VGRREKGREGEGFEEAKEIFGVAQCIKNL